MPDEQIEDAAFGTFNAIETLETIYETEDLPPDTITVNLLTLIRNRIRKDVPGRQTVTEIQDDIIQIISRVKNAIPTNMPVALIFYATDYMRVLTPQFARVVPPSKAEYSVACTTLLNTLKNTVQQLDNLIIVYFKIAPIKHYYRKLFNISRMTKTTQRIIMLSHVYSDFHIVSTRPDVKLLESYTGDTVPPGELGVKVFGTDIVPFYPETHLLLGDKHYVKPLMVRNDKKLVIQTAADEKWRYKSREAVSASIYKHRWLKPTERYPLI